MYDTLYWKITPLEHTHLADGTMTLRYLTTDSKHYLGEYNPPRFSYILGLGWDINKLIYRLLKSEYVRAYAKRRREAMVLINDEFMCVTFWLRYELRNTTSDKIEHKRITRTAFSNWSLQYNWEPKMREVSNKIEFNRKRSKFHCDEVLESENKKQRLT